MDDDHSIPVQADAGATGQVVTLRCDSQYYNHAVIAAARTGVPAPPDTPPPATHPRTVTSRPVRPLPHPCNSLRDVGILVFRDPVE